MEGKAVAAAVLPMLLLLFLQPPRAIADHLSVAAAGCSTTALFDACSRLPDLLTRTNMILLCNAILILVLRDAGLLASPPSPPRRNASDVTAATTTTTTTSTSVDAAVAVSAAASSRRRGPRATSRSDIVVWRPSKVAVVHAIDVDGNDGNDRFTRRRRRHRTRRHDEQPTRPPPAAEEKQSYDGGLDDSVSDDHVSAGAMIVLAEEAKIISSPVSNSVHCSAGDDTNGQDVNQCSYDDDDDDVEDMNRRFEEFIANTRRKMQLESLQLQLVMKA